MSTLQQIWNLSEEDVNTILDTRQVQKDRITNQSQSYIWISQLYNWENRLSVEEKNIVENPLFEEIMMNTNNINKSDRLVTGLVRMLNINVKPLKSSRDPLCKYNNFLEDEPIDPIDYDVITKNEIYYLNDTCYNKETIRQILNSGGDKDPLTRQKLSRKVYDDFNVKYGDSRTELDLSNKALTTSDLYQYKFPEYLIKLLLTNNQIDSLMKINFPDHLQELFVNDNQIYSIDNIKSLPELQLLNLNDNQLLQLNGISKFKKLIEIDCNHNQITIIVEIELLDNLSELYLSYNNIVSLEHVKFPKNLKILGLNNNNIKSLSNVNFPDSLLQLLLNNNNITKLDDIKLPNLLEKLYIKNNQINKRDQITLNNIEVLY